MKPKKSLALGAALVICLGCSCAHRSFKHISYLIDVKVGTNSTRLGTSPVYVALLRIDATDSKCLFRLTNAELGETTQEWVQPGAYFRSAPWLGSRGLKLDEIRTHSALVEKRWSDRK